MCATNPNVVCHDHTHLKCHLNLDILTTTATLDEDSGCEEDDTSVHSEEEYDDTSSEFEADENSCSSDEDDGDDDGDDVTLAHRLRSNAIAGENIVS